MRIKLILLYIILVSILNYVFATISIDILSPKNQSTIYVSQFNLTYNITATYPNATVRILVDGSLVQEKNVTLVALGHGFGSAQIRWKKQWNPSQYSDIATATCSDGRYIYVVGYTYDEGDSDTDGTSALIAKIDLSTGNILATIKYEPSDSDIDDDYDYLYDCVIVGNYLYAIGYTKAFGNAGRHIVKVDLSSFTKVAEYNYNYDISHDDMWYSIDTDGTYLYVVGWYYNGNYRYFVVQKLSLTGNIVATYTVDAENVFGCRSGSQLYCLEDGRETPTAIRYYNGYVYFIGYYVCYGDWGIDGTVDDYDYRTVIVKLNANDLSLVSYKVKDWYIQTWEGTQPEYINGIDIDDSGVYAIGDYYDGSVYHAFLWHLDLDLNDIGSTTWLSTFGNYPSSAQKVRVIKNYLLVTSEEYDGSYYHQAFRLFDIDLSNFFTLVLDDGSYNSYFDIGKMYINLTNQTLYVAGYDNALNNYEWTIYAIQLLPNYIYNETVPITIITEGSHTITVNVSDINLTESDQKTISINLDLYDLYNLTLEPVNVYNNVKYGHNVTIKAWVRCGVLGNTAQLWIKRNESEYQILTVTCDNSTKEYSTTFTPSTEGNKTVDVILYDINGVQHSSLFDWYIADLYPPELVLYYDVTPENYLVTKLIVEDSVSPVAYCTVVLNNEKVADNQLLQVNKEYTWTSPLEYGYNNLTVNCEDLAFHTSSKYRLISIAPNIIKTLEWDFPEYYYVDEKAKIEGKFTVINVGEAPIVQPLIESIPFTYGENLKIYIEGTGEVVFKVDKWTGPISIEIKDLPAGKRRTYIIEYEMSTVKEIAKKEYFIVEGGTKYNVYQIIVRSEAPIVLGTVYYKTFVSNCSDIAKVLLDEVPTSYTCSNKVLKVYLGSFTPSQQKVIKIFSKGPLKLPVIKPPEMPKEVGNIIDWLVTGVNTIINYIILGVQYILNIISQLFR